MSQRVGELLSSIIVDSKESVRVNDAGTAWEAFPPMDRQTYDSNNDGIVDKARIVSIVCRNTTGSTITKGSIVYVDGAAGNHPLIKLADKDSEATSSKTLGMVVADIAHNADGTVAVNGTVDDLNTNAYTAGTPLYLGDNGGWTSTRPTQPAHSVFIGWVTIQNNSNGRVVLHIQNGYELDELHDVLISSPANNQVLTYETSSGLWKNKTVSAGATSVGRLYSDFSTSDDADTLSISVPAGKLGTNGDILRGEYAGTCLVVGQSGAQFAISVAGTAYGPVGSNEVDTGDWSIRFTLVRVTSTTARITVTASWNDGTGLQTKTDYATISSGLNFANATDVGIYLSSNEFTTITAGIGYIEYVGQ